MLVKFYGSYTDYGVSICEDSTMQFPSVLLFWPLTTEVPC